jgi:hypothetical protein
VKWRESELEELSCKEVRNRGGGKEVRKRVTEGKGNKEREEARRGVVGGQEEMKGPQDR